jgi:hypothetical protein
MAFEFCRSSRSCNGLSVIDCRRLRAFGHGHEACARINETKERVVRERDTR